MTQCCTSPVPYINGLGAYGGWSYGDNSAATVITAVNTWTDIEDDGLRALTPISKSFAIDGSTPSQELAYRGSCPSSTVVLWGSISYATAGAGINGYELRIVKNGLPVPGTVFGRSVPQPSAEGLITTLGFSSIAQGDSFKLQIQNTINSDNATVNYEQLVALVF